MVRCFEEVRFERGIGGIVRHLHETPFSERSRNLAKLIGFSRPYIRIYLLQIGGIWFVMSIWRPYVHSWLRLLSWIALFWAFRDSTYASRRSVGEASSLMGACRILLCFVYSYGSHLGVLKESCYRWLLRGDGCLAHGRLRVRYTGPYAISPRGRAWSGWIWLSRPPVWVMAVAAKSPSIFSSFRRGIGHYGLA